MSDRNMKRKGKSKNADGKMTRIWLVLMLVYEQLEPVYQGIIYTLVHAKAGNADSLVDKSPFFGGWQAGA